MLYDTMQKLTRNVIKAPAVLLIRVPVVLIINSFVWLGEKADQLGNRINKYLPGFDR